MKIVTLTLNPALDIHYYLDNFKPLSENYAHSASKSAGGKGINVSRALSMLEVENRAVVILGNESAEEFKDLLSKSDISYEAVYCDAKIRENVTLHPHNDKETRISLDTFSITEENFNQAFCLADLKKNDILIFAGRLPKGILKSAVIEKLKELAASGVLLAVDCNSFTPSDIKELRPWFIKPNSDEAKALTGIDAEDLNSAYLAAVKLSKDYDIPNVLISAGKEGAAYYGEYGGFSVLVPKIAAVSTIGAGDSTVAGFVGAFYKNESIIECLRTACASGTAACLSEGTEPPTKENFSKIKSQIEVIKN